MNATRSIACTDKTLPNKILLIRFSALGDILQTLPILSKVRELFPKAHIGWVVDEDLSDVLMGHPAIDTLYLCPRKRWAKTMRHPSAWPSILREALGFIRQIRQERYDVALDLQGLIKTALLSYFSAVPRRIGYAHGREGSRLFYTETVGDAKTYFDPAILHYQHMLALANAIIPEQTSASGISHASYSSDTAYHVELAPVPEKTDAEVAAWLPDKLQKPENPIIAISPATQWPSKHWPVSSWQSLVQKILAETPYSLVFAGSGRDRDLIAQILDTVPEALTRGRIVNLAGQTSIPQLQALYKRVTVAIGPDSAPLHLAAAIGMPAVIGLYGPTGAYRTPPLGSPHVQVLTSEGDLPCQPCHKKICPLGTLACMHRLSPEQAYQAVLKAISDTTAGKSLPVSAYPVSP